VSDVYAVLKSLRANELPRNRHFEFHRTPEAAAARQLHRFLRGLERDVLRATRVTLADDAHRPGRLLSLEFAEVRSTRKVWLNDEEFALLRENPKVAARL